MKHYNNDTPKTEKEKEEARKKEREAVPVKRSKGSYQKQIVANIKKSPEATDSAIFKINHGGYFFFEIEVDKKANFSLEVLKASNEEATRENVYWVAQDYKHFGTRKFLKFKHVNNALALHEFLNSLNEGTKYGGPTLKNGKPNPNYDPSTADIRTLENTAYVGKNYFATNPYLSNTVKRVLENNVYFGNLAYKTNKKGEGVWIEGINYKAEFKSQGAFVIAVGAPEILNFYAEKRTRSEREVDALGVKKQDCDAVAQTLIYGDVIDLHLNLHNVVDYTADIEIFCDGKSMNRNENNETYLKYIPLKKHFNNENPSLNYNIAFIDELVTDIRWANKSNHEAGKGNKDALKEYKLKLTLTPLERKALDGRPHYERKTLSREITFTVNYTSNFSLDEHEPEYVAQVVKVKQLPLVTQSYEMCKYTELKMQIQGQDAPIVILQEQESGALTDNKTPYFNIIAGNKANAKEITISTNIDNENVSVANCVNEESHINNVFDTSSIIPYNYKAKFSDNIFGRVLSKIYNSNMFEDVQPFTLQGTPNEQQLKFKAAFPYNSINNTTFLVRYLTMQLNPVPLDISVKSCRYVRTPKIWIHPDVKWGYHLNFDMDEKKRVYFESKQVTLAEGHGTYMSYLGAGVDWLNTKLKPSIKRYLVHTNNEDLNESWENVQNIIEGFVEDSTTKIALGFHAVYDGEKEKNYAEISPYSHILNYQIFQIALATLVVDILMIYLTKGKVSPGMSKFAKVAKKIQNAKNKLNKFSDKHDIDFLMPQISISAGIYKKQEKFGNIATVFEWKMKAAPLIGVKTEYKFEPEQLPTALKKFSLSATVKGLIDIDVVVNYNTYTKKFTIPKGANVTQQGSGGNLLENGDIFQTEGRVAFTLVANGAYEDEFELWKFLPVVKTSIELGVDLHTSTGFTRRLGVDAIRGPYIEDALFFDGIEGTYFQNFEVKVGRRKVSDTNKTNEKKKIANFGKTNISLGKTYLFEMFSLA